MPKTIYFPPSVVNMRSGIDVTWTPSSGRLYIGGWYDSTVGIEGTDMGLGEFFSALGITEKDCRKALKRGANA